MKVFSLGVAACMLIGLGLQTGCEERTDAPLEPTHTQPADPALDARPIDPIEDRGTLNEPVPERETPIRDALQDDGIDINVDRGTGNPNDNISVEVGGGEGVNVEVPNP